MMNNRSKYNIRSLLVFLIIVQVIFWPVFFSMKIFLENNQGNFRFENPDMLWGLFVIPVYLVSLVFYLVWKNKKLNLLAENKLLAEITQPVSGFLTGIRSLLIQISLFCFIIALANPQYGKGTRTAKSEGVDIIIALDVSNSMLTADATNKWSRLKKSKLDIERLINKLTGDRLGIIVFAGVPVVQLPVTSDLAASRFFLSGINTDMISIQGTDIGSAIELASSSFPEDEKRQKVLIIVTDGENHEQEAIIAAQQAKQNNITIHSIGLGSEKGAPVPHYVNGKYLGLKRDNSGNTVISKLNKRLLMDIASAGGGMYVDGNGEVSPLEIINDEIRKMEQTEIESIEYPEYEDRFQWFLFIAVLALFLEISLPSKSYDLFNKIITHVE